MIKEESSHLGLYHELMKLKNSGVTININGYGASPIQITNAHMIKEKGSYMRDYELNEDGTIASLSFWSLGLE